MTDHRRSDRPSGSPWDRPQQPRSEPEIIPPDRSGERWRSQAGGPHVWISFDRTGGGRRIHMARPGPLGVVVALLLTGLIFAAVVLVLLGVVLFWIPALIFIVVGLVLSGYLRRTWRRLQHWAGQHLRR